MVAWKRLNQGTTWKISEHQVGIYEVIRVIGVAHLFCSYELILCEDNKTTIHGRFRDQLR